MKTCLYILLVLALLFSSCNKEFENAMKSNDPEYILPIAKKFYDKKKYDYANRLYSHSVKYVYGTDYAKEVTYYSAKSNLGFKNYPLAAQQFKDYASSYKNDSLAEEAYYMSAFCYYQGSADYNLDQTNTYKALNELQNFINEYPDSEKVPESNNLIKELQKKLEKKAFENAKTLFKTAKYRASSLAFDNVLNDFPDTYLQEEILWLGFQSKSNYAFESRNDVKKERLDDAMTAYRILKKTYPNSEFIKDADKIVSKINNEYTHLEKTQELASNQIETK